MHAPNTILPLCIQLQDVLVLAGLYNKKFPVKIPTQSTAGEGAACQWQHQSQC